MLILDKQVNIIACGEDHSIFITNENEIFGCGRGEKGQLGIGYATHREFRPIRMKGDLPSDQIKAVTCGSQ